MTDVFDSVADGLAGPGHCVVDQFLSQTEVQDILALNVFQADESGFRKAGIGKNKDLQINEAIRGDYIQWIDKSIAPAAVRIPPGEPPPTAAPPRSPVRSAGRFFSSPARSSALADTW